MRFWYYYLRRIADCPLLIWRPIMEEWPSRSEASTCSLLASHRQLFSAIVYVSVGFLTSYFNFLGMLSGYKHQNLSFWWAQIARDWIGNCQYIKTFNNSWHQCYKAAKVIKTDQHSLNGDEVLYYILHRPATTIIVMVASKTNDQWSKRLRLLFNLATLYANIFKC